VNGAHHVSRAGFIEKEFAMPHRDQEIQLLREEVEMLVADRQQLLQIVGAVAGLVASLDSNRLPVGAIESADLVATMINRLPEETLHDALAAVHAEIDEENAKSAQASA
jgi:hypothetical protein